MTSTPQPDGPQPAAEPEAHRPSAPPRSPEPHRPSAARRPREPGAALVFDDPLSRPSTDDTDEGWGDRPRDGGTGAADLARFLDEKPPHHL